jgi:hypothetical protein
VPAAILGRAPALDQPVGLQVVDQPDEVGPVELQIRRQRLLAAESLAAAEREIDALWEVVGARN